jgi:hypothetical protein
MDEFSRDQMIYHLDVTVVDLLGAGGKRPCNIVIETHPVVVVGWLFLIGAYRYGNWKLAVGGVSCDPEKASFDCLKPQLYDMATDIGENFDLADKQPEILSAILRNFTVWQKSVLNSMANESMCPPKPVEHQIPFPSNPPTTSSPCAFVVDAALGSHATSSGTVQTQEECCGACTVMDGCVAIEFSAATAMRPTWDGRVTGGT